ncbi:MAG TPA: AAA family ATPase [Candidatus Saccharimonadales bacterium]|nr:AAA family ATPase [Candidatus Saccharimonadales bacterium]
MKPSETTKPHLIIMVGIPCSGKSFFAEHFAETFKAPIVSYDHLRKQIFSNPTFTEDENDIIKKVSDHVLSEVLKTKKTVIFEGQTGLRSERFDIEKKARGAGYEPLLIWVQTETLAAQKRATKSSLEKPSLTIDEFNAKLKKFSAPNKNEKVIVISGKHTYASQLKIVLKHLIQPHAETDEQKNMTRTPKNRSFLIR